MSIRCCEVIWRESGLFCSSVILPCPSRMPIGGIGKQAKPHDNLHPSPSAHPHHAKTFLSGLLPHDSAGYERI